MIKNFKPRLYQETIFATAINHNTLVVLPTGMGKTAIAMMMAAQRLKQYDGSKILVLAPTKPLVEQIMQVFRNNLSLEEIEMFTGQVTSDKRQELWKKSKIIISTPQSIENDLINKRISLTDVSLLVFDECHRAVKDYSYVWVAKQYEQQAQRAKILGLTASPGSDLEVINEVCQNLFIEEIEIRTDKDSDVKEYVQDVDVQWEKVVLPLEFKQIQQFLKDCVKTKIIELRKLDVINNISMESSKKELLGMQAQLRFEISQGDKSLAALRSISLMAEIMKVQHGLELIETQGVTALNEYLDKIHKESYTTKTKATINLAKDINFKSALIRSKTLIEKEIEHPKLDKLKSIISDEYNNNPNVKIIVFNQYRGSAKKIVEELNTLENITSKLFVGQAKKVGSGLTQKKQIEMLNDFRENKFNILVSSSVGEEGLDIPQVNLVIFFEPIPSAVRSIQRRGRTGRLSEGKVIVLLAQGTRDEAYRWSAFHKENKMYRNLELLKKTFKLQQFKKQVTLTEYIYDGLNIHVDYREKGSKIIKDLIENGCNVKLEKLEVGDYVLSDNCAIEYKTQNDFVSSLLDGRLMEQLSQMKSNYSKSLVIVEGHEEIYKIKNIHPNAIRGMLASIAVGYGIPILFTKDYKESSAMIAMIAKREQKESKEFSVHGSNKPKTWREQQEYVISSLPGIGLTLARPLLEKFGSVKAIVNADIKDLKEIEKIGDIKARMLKELVDKEYN